MKTTLSQAAKVAIAFGVQDLRGLRCIAATYLSRFAYEIARDGATSPFTEALATRLALRFKLGDYFGAVFLAYLSDMGKREAYQARFARSLAVSCV